MNIKVIDTSALMRLYLPDGPLPIDLASCMDSAWNGNVALMAPELIWAEAGQVLWTKQRIGVIEAPEADEILAAILELPIETVGHRNLLTSALDLARRYKVTVHDALFLTLSRKMRATLITADEALLRAYEKMAGQE